MAKSPTHKDPGGRVTYVARTGLNYRPHGDPDAAEVRREPGDEFDDLAPSSAAWLLRDGHIALKGAAFVDDAPPDAEKE